MTVEYQVSKKTISETPFLYMQKQVKAEDVADALASHGIGKPMPT